MTEISPPATAETPQASRPTIGHILYKTGIPLFIFSIVFSGVLGVSRFAILPTLTAVEVGGETRDAAALEAEAAAIRSTLQNLEQERDSDILPLGGTLYRTLADAKITAAAPIDILHAIGDIASTVVLGNPKAITLSRFMYAPGDHTITLTGDVRGVGPSSMTVLAQFTETLRTDPRIDSVIAPSFTRLEDSTVGPHSPFTLSLTLR
jgi:hypothetical protein